LIFFLLFRAECKSGKIAICKINQNLASSFKNQLQFPNLKGKFFDQTLNPPLQSASFHSLQFFAFVLRFHKAGKKNKEKRKMVITAERRDIE